MTKNWFSSWCLYLFFLKNSSVQKIKNTLTMCAKKSSMQLVFSLLLLLKNVKKQKMKKRQNWGKNEKWWGRYFFSLKQQQIMQVHMKLFVDKIILNVVIWITQDILEYGGFYKNGEICSGECEETKLKYIRKKVICLRHKESYTIMVIIGLKQKRWNKWKCK